MNATTRSHLEQLAQEAREVQRQVSALRRQRQTRVAAPELPEERWPNFYDAALTASLEQHNEAVRERLADKSRALAEVEECVREGTYGLCRACGCRIPSRRLRAMPTAVLCVSCQEKQEAGRRL